MSVIEIRFRNDEAYLQKHHDMTVDEYEGQIKVIKYEHVYDKYKNIKDEKGSEKEKFPPINFVFYESIFENGKVLLPNELTENYFKKNNMLFDFDGDFITYNGHVYTKDSLIARILRTYPSLIRDFHFFLMLVEEKCFENVIYSCQNDIKGRDIIIKHNGKEYEISLFTDTRRANFFKKIKNATRHIYGSNEIQIPINFKTAKKCGDFFVYGGKDLEKVINEIL